MDQDAMVTEQKESGERLIEALAAAGFDVRVAFWAKPTDDGKWFLYLASPTVDEKGARTAYQLVFDVLEQIPDPGIEPLEIKVIGLNDSLARAVLAVMKTKVPNGLFATRNPKTHRRMLRFDGSVLGGTSIDGAYIYFPPVQPAV
jgi:hypothetical protein